jgi:hypothetical protein
MPVAGVTIRRGLIDFSISSGLSSNRWPRSLAVSRMKALSPRLAVSIVEEGYFSN